MIWEPRILPLWLTVSRTCETNFVAGLFELLNFRRLLICLSLNFIGVNLVAQDFEREVVKKFERYRDTHLQEKIYAHTNEDVYLTGEMLWVKLYYVDGAAHKPLDLSKVAYVDVIDKDNRTVLQAKILLSRGSGNGSIFIPASIASGNYTFRAYTNWMKNFRPEFYFSKRITIVNPFQKIEGNKTDEAGAVAIDFFPEGGNLVADLTNTIAFRAVNSTGVGIPFRGYITDERNDTVASFKPARFGIGRFQFTPVAGRKYQSVVSDARGKKYVFKFPESIDNGYLLHAEPASGKIRVSIKTRATAAFNEPVYLFIHAREQIAFAERVKMQNGEANIQVRETDVQDGISHITLFDATMNPVCERLIFKKPASELTLKAFSDQPSYETRKKVTIRVGSSNQTANLSIAVAKTDSIENSNHANIRSYLLLTSDLKGTVESPDYYLDQQDPEVVSATDDLMLTHGWRRFSWRDVMHPSDSTGLLTPEYRGHFIRGRVADLSGRPAKEIETYLSAPGKTVRLYGARSDSTGALQFEMLDFMGPQKIIVQTNTRRDSTYRIEIQNPFSDAFDERKPSPFFLSPKTERQLISRSVGMQVQDVFYKDKNERFYDPGLDSIAFYGRIDELYNLDDYVRFPVMEEVLREYVTGAFVRKRRDGFHFMMLDRVNGGVIREDPLVLLDGIPVFDNNKIMDFNPLQVKTIELVTRRFFHGLLMFPGIISLRTYSGDMGDFRLDPKSISLDYEGLQLQREFYSPQYDTPLQQRSRMPDRRNLLYWNPNVNTDASGEKKFEFYTSDVKGEFKVTIEGISNTGTPGSRTFTFTVK